MASSLARASLTLLLLTTGAVTVVFGVFRLNDIASALTTGMKPLDVFDARYVAHPLPSVVHIALGTAFMIIGPLQFVPAIRQRWSRLHRWLGRVFVLAGLVVGGSALYMAAAFPAYGGRKQPTPFSAATSCWRCFSPSATPDGGVSGPIAPG